MSEDKKVGFAEEVANKFIKAIEEGTAPWMKPWKAGEIADSPYNAETGKAYKGLNRLMLSLDQTQRGSEDPRYCTYNQAQNLGAQVKKGAKGVKIAVWKTHEERLERDENGKPKLDEEGNKQYKKVALEKPQLFSATVFHASDIANMPELPSAISIPEWKRHEEAEKVLKNSGVKILHDQADRAFYRPATDSIHLPKPEQFKSQDDYYSTALHETVHSTGHQSRLNRDMAHPFGSTEYAKEELRAEIGSFMLAGELGLGHDPQRHAGYVENWLKVLKDDPLEVFKASRDAEQAKNYLLDLSKEKELEKEKAIQAEIATLPNQPNPQYVTTFIEQARQATTLDENHYQATVNELKEQEAYSELVVMEAHRKGTPEQQERAETILFREKGKEGYLDDENGKNLKALASELKIEVAKSNEELEAAFIEHYAQQEKVVEEIIVKNAIKESKENGQNGLDANTLEAALKDYNDSELVMLVAHSTKETTQEQVALAEELFKKDYINLKLEPDERQQLEKLASELNINLNHREDYLQQRSEQINQDQTNYRDKTLGRLGDEFSKMPLATNEHPYLKNNVLNDPLGAKLDVNNNLCYQVLDDQGKNAGLLRVNEKGEKHLDSPDQNAHLVLKPTQGDKSSISEPAIIGSDLESCATVVLATKRPVVVSLGEKNTTDADVVNKLQELYPIKSELISTTQEANANEKLNSIKPSLTKKELEQGSTSFADLAKSRGLEKVAAQVEKQLSQKLSVAREAVSEDQGLDNTLDKEKEKVQELAREKEKDKTLEPPKRSRAKERGGLEL